MPPKKPQDHLSKSESLAFDPNDLTLGELETFEEVCGKPFAEALPASGAAKDWVPGIKEIVALTYIIKRREDPEFTLDDARNTRIGELELFGGDVRPTPPAG